MGIKKILGLIFLVFVFFVSLSVWLCLYPQYLMFIPKFTFQNKFYSVQVCSFIISLPISGKEVCGYYRIFQCEENYHGKWMLEQPQGFIVLTDNSTHFIVKSHSNLFTENLVKTWIFLKNKPYFFVNITKTYLVSDWDMNNQIIVDVQKNSNVTFMILDSNPSATWQYDGKTEFQIDFNGQQDRELLYHEKDLVETVLVEVTINE